MSILTALRRALVLARTHDEAFHTLNGMSDRKPAMWRITRAEVWLVADHVARETTCAAPAAWPSLLPEEITR